MATEEAADVWGTVLSSDGEMYTKQYIILRTDLGMRPGKLIAQGGHAAVSSAMAALKATADVFTLWMESGQTKISLKVESEEKLLFLEHYCKTHNIPHALVFDEGRTQLKEPAYTALGIGPILGTVEPCRQLKLFT
jgi:peptidyl-tRNA hydrolase